ncbi:ChrR family anti-sigma-E factor [Roseisalinus antarcticus]|uniref:Anti-sigma-E factor ChrR n=1 Tax=Roseisalinus antarcticus TaxID=254357 RepID=A0A1Y5SMJ4_9RHOB|nr:ChrR family anti-sigma-E factor [Roseisalinus antarcticus]SLN43582.1 Anti-sigma-E factor ChrR [Roseisalinus antarcticus]
MDRNETIKHHLSDALLMNYSAGTLPEAFDLAVAAHVSLCDSCRARMMAFDTVGGAVLESTEEAEVSEDSLAATLRLIETAPAEKPLPVRRGGVLPTPIQRYVGGDVDAVSWRRLGGGVYDSVIPVQGEAKVRLLRIPGGAAVPDHGHEGGELTLVLKGAYRDEIDRFGPGDVEFADDDLNHTPVAETGEDCICLAATEAPLKFRKLLPRIAQRVMRI